MVEFEEFIRELGLDYEKFDASLEFELVNGSFEIDAAFFDYQFNESLPRYAYSAGRMYSLLLYEHIDPTRLHHLTVPTPTRLLEEMVPTLGTGIRGLVCSGEFQYRKGCT